MGDRALVIFQREGSNVRGQTEFQVTPCPLTPCPPRLLERSRQLGDAVAEFMAS